MPGGRLQVVPQSTSIGPAGRSIDRPIAEHSRAARVPGSVQNDSIARMALPSGEVEGLEHTLGLRVAIVSGPVDAGDEVNSFAVVLARHRSIHDGLNA